MSRQPNQSPRLASIGTINFVITFPRALAKRL